MTQERIEVLRGGPYMIVGGVAFLLNDLISRVDEKTAAAGVKFPGSNRPPFFRTGSPYGAALLALGATPVPMPDGFREEYVPMVGPITHGERMGAKVWSEVFSVDPMLHFEYMQPKI